MPTAYATIAEFKARFVRDFVYGATADMVMDGDITNALTDASMMFNAGLWDDATARTLAFLYLSAHFMALNVQAAGGLSLTNQGVGVQGQGGGIMTNRSVDGVSATYALPEMFTKNPILAQLGQTPYGQKYVQMLYPRLVGNVSVVAGWSDTGAPNGF